MGSRIADSVTGIHAKRLTLQVPFAPIAHIMPDNEPRSQGRSGLSLRVRQQRYHDGVSRLKLMGHPYLPSFRTPKSLFSASKSQ